MTREIWKSVKDYEGLYEVSNLGRVKSLSKKVEGTRYGKHYEFITEPFIMKPAVDNKGYYRISLTKDGKRSTKKIHRLVAEAFIGDIYNKEIDHINTTKTDNRVENLKIVTSKENSNNPLSIEHYRKGNNGKVAKKVKCTMEDGTVYIFSSLTEAENKGYGKISLISQCCNGKIKTHYNKKWEFIN